jgi:hypothetical protein
LFNVSTNKLNIVVICLFFDKLHIESCKLTVFMKIFVLFFLFLSLFSDSYAQENIPIAFRNSVKLYKAQNIEKGFYLIKHQNPEFFFDNSNLQIIRRLENGFSIFHTNGFADKNQSSGKLYRLTGNWNYASSLKNLLQNNRFQTKRIQLSVKSLKPDTFESTLFYLIPEARILSRYKDSFIIELEAVDLEKFSSDMQVYFIDSYHMPSTETPVNSNDISVNKINTLQHIYPDINGSGMAVSVKELLFDSTDIDFKNRYFFTGLEAEQLDQHASAMGTVIGGGGNSSSKGKGVAPAVELTSSSFLRLLPDEDSNFSENNISVQNHSYGTLVQNEYGNEAAAYDEQMNALSTIIHVFSSGNQGTTTPENGPYAGIEGYANQTGNFKMAKNIITVGAITANGEIDARSSKGPAYDGRVKPELASYAPGGTSDASALVAGTTVVLQQFYKEQNDGQLPSASLVKAVLIAAAEDVGPPAIDYQSGYGSMNALQSIRVLENGNFIEGTIAQNETNTYEITIPDNTAEIRIATSWNDPAANPGDTKALVNNIDVALISPDAAITLPWILNSFPQIDSITKQATRGIDNLNNNELISLQNPSPGTYTVRVTGSDISTGSQSFSIAYFLESTDTFEWTYPTASDALESNDLNRVRWNNTFPEETGQLEININNNGWEVLNETVALSEEAVSIDFSEIQGTVQLRMIIGGDVYTSDTFGVSPEILPSVLYNCEEEIALGWNEVTNATGYLINNLSDRYMEVLQTVSDTLIVLPKSAFENPYFSVTPVFNTVNGIQGRTFDYELQAVNCYFINFFAFLAEENTVNATLNLSTTLNVESVTFQKTNNANTTILSFREAPFNDLNLNIADVNPESGTNAYSAIIGLTDGRQIITEPVEVFIPTNETLIIYPNPYQNSNRLFIVSGGAGRDLEIIDLSGRVVFREEILFIDERLNPNLLPGIYIVRLVQDGKTLKAKKLIVN